jgi:hypothetical protein
MGTWSTEQRVLVYVCMYVFCSPSEGEEATKLELRGYAK